MRRHLYAKFLLGYLIFGVLSFLTIAFFSAHLTEKYLTQSTGEKLYTEATLLADACSIPYSGSGPDMESAEPAMQSVATYMGASAWLMDRQGEIVYDSSGSGTGQIIEAFDPAATGQSHYTVGRFYDYFSQDMITVWAFRYPAITTSTAM